MKANGKLWQLARPAVFGVLQHTPRLRWTVRRAWWGVQRRKYERLRDRTPVDKKLVFFESYGGRSVSCSPKALYEAMLADSKYNQYRFVWSAREERLEHMRQVLSTMDNSGRTRVVRRGGSDYFTALARAGSIIVNTRLPEYVWPSKEQTYVQCWHGTPLKRLGYDVQIETTNALNTTDELAWRFGIDARKWTYLLSPSKYTTQHLCSAFGLPERLRSTVVIEQGYPRNDRLALAEPGEKQLIRRRLGIPEGRKVVLYTPTWRDDQYRADIGYMAGGLIDFNRLQQELGDEWIVLFRAHYHVSGSVDLRPYKGFVMDVSSVDDINDLYLASDVLLTDYSSVMFDYAVTGKPMVLYMPDRKHYAEQVRGFYMPMDDIPAPKCESTEQVCHELSNINTWHNRFGTLYLKFRDTYCLHDDGHASERVLEQIF